MGTLPARADVVVVGAGLAGLAAARWLAGASVDVLLVEAADTAGGRVRTDHRDGLLLDHGFQLFNPAYPEARRELDLEALDLQPFEAGVVVAHGDSRYILADPRRSPRDLLRTMRAPVGSLRERLALLRWAAAAGFGSPDRLKRADDETLGAALRRRGLDGDLGRGVLRPFLAGVLADDDLDTSRRFAELLVRAFVRGAPALPSRGMQALPDQLAACLPAGVLECSTRADEVSGNRVITDRGTVAARAVVVATDPLTAGTLTGVAVPAMRGLTTFYHRADEAPSTRALLHLDAARRGPVVNTAVVSNAAPTYAAEGALIASTVLGNHPELAPVARAQAGQIFGVDASRWAHVAAYAIPAALPAMPPGTPLRRPVDLGDGLFVAGDHRDTPSIQGALVSGRRTAQAVLGRLSASRRASGTARGATG